MPKKLDSSLDTLTRRIHNSATQFVLQHKLLWLCETCSIYEADAQHAELELDGDPMDVSTVTTSVLIEEITECSLKLFLSSSIKSHQHQKILQKLTQITLFLC